MEPGTVTTILAVWGSILATSLAVFEVFKWKRTGKPSLRISASAPLVANNPFGGGKQQYISIRIANTGDRATTLVVLTFRYYQEKPDRKFKKAIAQRGMFNPFRPSSNLPAKLETGETWTDLIPLDPDIRAKAQNGYYYIEIEDSSTDNASKFARTRLIIR